MNDGIETTRTAVAGDVRVRKTIETGPDDTGTVTLDVDVERDAPTTVRLTEPALGLIPRDEIELHTDHGAEFWRVGEEATFEREFDAGESYRVVYRVTGVDAERFDALDEDPVVEPVGASAEEFVDRGRSDAVRNLIEGDRESLLATAPGPDGVDLSFESGPDDDETPDEQAEASASGEPRDESPAESSPEEISVDVPSAGEPGERDVDSNADAVREVDTEAATDDAAAPEQGSVADAETDPAPAPDPDPGQDADDESAPESVPTAGSAAASADDLDASLAATPSGGVARVLLEELRSGDVDEATRAALREELEPGRSQDLRINHLQSRVGEFAAYVEMLESFVDEHGTFEEVVGGMDATVEALDEEVDELRSELDGLAESVGEDVDALEDDVDALETGVDDLGDGQDDLETRVERLEDELATVDDRLDGLEAFEERLSGVFQGLEKSS